ncbi:MAG TPA: Mur ligase family protein [Pirellulaceae bacterium]|nr:Mur ligase family protein [Pirellulaceae bacterium]
MSTQTWVETQQVPGWGYSLRKLLPQAKSVGGRDVLVTSCCGNWRECRPNDLYVAVEGSHEDGHDFAQNAIDQGASAIVGERLLAVSAPQFIVEDSRIALGTICHALSGNPCQHLRTIGVAGTDGKTVISLLIDSILRHANLNCAAATSLRGASDLWDQESPDIPDNSPSIAHWLGSVMAAGRSHAVLEISSLTLAQHGLAGAQLDVAVLGNIRRDHLAFHGTAENYRDVQSRVLKYLRPDGTLILNADDPTSRRLLDVVDVPALTVGIHQPAEITASLLDRQLGLQTFLLTAGGDSAVVSTAMIGKHHIYNCLTAAAVGLALGIDLPTVVAGIERLQPLPVRLECLSSHPFSVWLDSGRRTSQLAAAIQTIGQETRRRLHVVATIDGRSGSDQLRHLGHLLERVADQVTLTQDRAEPCYDYEPMHQVLDGFETPGQAMVIPNRWRAIEWALSQAEPGDAVLVAGDGRVNVAVDGESPCWITDRDVCQAWLSNRVGPRTDDDPGNESIHRLDDFRP